MTRLHVRLTAYPLVVDFVNRVVAWDGWRGRVMATVMAQGNADMENAAVELVNRFLFVCLIVAFVTVGCTSSERAGSVQRNESPEVSVTTDESSLPQSVKDCLAATEQVAESLRAGNTESALKAQEICRKAMIDLNVDGQGTQLGTRLNAASGFISDLNSAVASAIISAGQGALSPEDYDRLNAEYRSSVISIERVLDPNYPFVGMSE